jgi:formylglycine-generating enzyme required for sulfatase activity
MGDRFPFDVFLSHNARDKPRVRRLAERLKGAGLRVWFDEWVIRPGDDIYLAIERGLETSRTLALCMSPALFGSDWVGLERSAVLFRDPTNADRRFIPLLLTDCDIPDTLRRYKHIDYRKEGDAAFEELLVACRPNAETPQPATQPKHEKKARPRRKPQRPEPLGVMDRSPTEHEDGRHAFTPKPFVVQDLDDASKLAPTLTNGCGIDFVLVKGGPGRVGDLRYISDGPQAEVRISPFYISTNPVTNRDFFLFVRRFHGQMASLEQLYGEHFLHHWITDGPKSAQMEHPVTFVSWKSAVQFCEWLQALYPLRVGMDIARVELKYRLPTEVEWEFAARGGKTAAAYPWGDAPPDRLLLNYHYNEGGTTECKKYPPNAFGLYDMSGNVGEWCLDDFSLRRADGSGQENPCCCCGSEVKIIKGGSWRSKDDLVRVSFRDKDHYLFCDEDVGFRIAAEVTFRR